MTYTRTHFLTFILLACIGVMASTFFIPRETHAYFTTDQHAESLNQKSVLFTIDYTFGVEKHNIHMPVLTSMGENKSTTTASYVIVNEAGEAVEGTATGIIFSKAKLQKNGMYEVRKGIANSFTLAVIFTPTEHPSTHSYHLQMTNLPFNFDGTQQLQLNPSELQYYKTKSITI